jgi:branched-chain amino acid transport system ATP-binding protein
MLRVLELEVVYHSVIRVLKGIDVVVPEGNIVALLGANGAGKTTLIRAITGLLPIQNGKIVRGSIEWLDQEITGLSSTEVARRGILQVMEGRRIFSDLTVEENLILGAYSRRDGEIRRDLERYLELFPVLKERFRNLAGYLSGGEQQMLAIARALMSRPRLLLLDEPSLGLAPVIVEEIARLIKKINAEGVTILLVEQNAQMGLELSHYGYVLENGTIALEGSPEELLQDADIQEFYLGLSADQSKKSFREVKYYRKRKSWLS